MKTEVYSWRLSPELKAELEREARARKVSLGVLLEEAARDLLKKKNGDVDDEETQRRLHEKLAQYIGVFSGDDPRGSEKVSETIREDLRRRYGG